MSEVSRLLFELGAGTLATVLGIFGECRAARRARPEPDAGDGMTLEEIGLQLDALDAMIEAETEPAVRLRREDDQWRARIRQTLLDIDDLAALPDPPASLGAEEPMEVGPIAAVLGESLFDPESSPHERARVFLSTGRTINGLGDSFSFLIAGNRGRIRFSAGSGSSQNDIITAIEQFRDVTGVVALQDTVDPNLIRLTSLRRGPSRYVGAGLARGNLHNAFYDENRANPADRQVDFGA